MRGLGHTVLASLASWILLGLRRARGRVLPVRAVITRAAARPAVRVEPL